jgi:serine/threonine protein kinase
MAISAGTLLGAYEILSPLGAGGMGEVYLARDTRLNREVAVKVLSIELAADAAHLKRFENEASPSTRSASRAEPRLLHAVRLDGEGRRQLG